MSAPDWAAQVPITRTAPAKVNLFLHITGRRADGYHELESLFAFTRTGDRVTVSGASALQFTLTGPFAGALAAVGGEADNLVCDAARALASHAGVEPFVALELEKNLPVAAGIGGGSADAAATLLALNDFWKLGLDREQLEPIALSLGADVPACLYDQPLLVRGIGENLAPVALGWQAGILLVNPGVHVSTPAIFRRFKEEHTPFEGKLADAPAICASLEEIAGQTRNSLQPPAIAECGAIFEVLAVLATLPDALFSRMSGSGATCFALFETEAAAEAAAERLRSSYPRWWVMADRLG